MLYRTVARNGCGFLLSVVCPYFFIRDISEYQHAGNRDILSGFVIFFCVRQERPQDREGSFGAS